MAISELFGGNDGADAARDAAEIESQHLREALAETARQFDVTTARLQPFVDAGAGSLVDLQQGATSEGLDARLSAILNGEAFGSIVDDRTKLVQQQLAAGGLTRSGFGIQEAANIPTELALALDDVLNNRQSNLFGSSQNAAAGLGSLGAQNSALSSQLLSNTGSSIGQGIIGGAQADAAGTQNLLNTALTGAALFLSDPRLKENMESIGTMRPIGKPELTLYEWDWKEGISDVLGEMTIGFNAEEVAEKYPHQVAEIHGFKAINYPELIRELKEAA